MAVSIAPQPWSQSPAITSGSVPMWQRIYGIKMLSRIPKVVQDLCIAFLGGMFWPGGLGATLSPSPRRLARGYDQAELGCRSCTTNSGASARNCLAVGLTLRGSEDAIATRRRVAFLTLPHFLFRLLRIAPQIYPSRPLHFRVLRSHNTLS